MHLRLIPYSCLVREDRSLLVLVGWFVEYTATSLIYMALIQQIFTVSLLADILAKGPGILKANFSVATPGTASEGTWDSIHVFEAIDRARFTQYNLTSTVILSLATTGSAAAGQGEMDLSGNMTRQIEMELPAETEEQQIANIGRLVEDMELKMRNLLQEVYFGKAKDVVGDLRSLGSLSEAGRDREAQREIIGSMRR